MFESLFDIPLWIAGTVIIGVLCAFSVAGLLLVRGRVLPRLRLETGDSEFTGSMLQSVMVFYGLAANFAITPGTSSTKPGRRCIHQPEFIILFQSGRCPLAHRRGAAVGSLHRTGHFHGLVTRPSLSR
jgi:hypothetical protein